MRWFFSFLVGFCVLSSQAVACEDCGEVRHGLLVEGRQFAGLVDTLTGAFRTHTPEFHLWRIKDREGKLITEPKAEWYDELAISHDAVGNPDAAVRVMAEKAEHFPELYETEAYWGTFLIHAGDLPEGIKHLERAIAMDATAHGGREVYQKYLAEYVLDRQAAGRADYPYGKDGTKFPDYLATKLDRSLTVDDTKAAIIALQEVLRFNSHESPVVLEAMGETLERQNREEHKLEYMTAAAFLQATRHAQTDEAKVYLDQRATGAVGDNRFLKDACREELEGLIQKSNTDFESRRLKEVAWIKSGADVDAEAAQEIALRVAVEDNTESFEQTRAREARQERERLVYMRQARQSVAGLIGGLVGLPLLILGVTIVAIKRKSRRKYDSPVAS